MIRMLLPALLLAAGPVLARAPILSQPVDCTLGESCFILQYVDADPGPGAADFTCGPLSYDGHKGTDFALPSLAAMAQGVDVLAAAPGVVRGVRDGMPDLGADDTPAALLDGRDCGNGVVIDHGAGWETQYCHLGEGSVTVRPGQRVTMGAVLGRVGLSGRTQFPHVHLSVRHEGRAVDPFNTDEITTCGQDDGPEDDLWRDSPAYRPGGLVAIGAAPGVPAYGEIKAGRTDHPTLGPEAPALVAWGFGFGARPGDSMDIAIAGPDGGELIRSRQQIGHKQALYFRAAGKTRPADGWAPGIYRITVSLLRDGTTLDSRSATVTLGD